VSGDRPSTWATACQLAGDHARQLSSDVAVNHDPSGFRSSKNGLETQHHLCPSVAPDWRNLRRGSHPGAALPLAEEHVRHGRIVVLPGVEPMLANLRNWRNAEEAEHT